MENMSGVYNIHNCAFNGRQSLLPPRSPVPGMEPCGVPIFTPRNELRHHRTSSESVIVEEQPSWIDDLLHEPERPIRRGAHHRSSSDSFAYLDVPSITSNLHVPASLEYNRSLMPQPSWGAQAYDGCKYLHYPSYYHGRPQSRGWETCSGAGGYQVPSNLFSNSKSSHKNVGSLKSTCEADRIRMSSTKKQSQGMSANQTPEGPPEMTEGPLSSTSQPDAEQKRIKQHVAQRSRVRRLQYIAELERNVEALQDKGSETSAELRFLDQQNIILSMENETLRQRLDSLSQEHLLKQFQQEMLEKEISRLRSYLLQQQGQLPAYSHGHSSSRDLDFQFASLSLNHNEAKSARDTIPTPLHI